MIEEISLNWKEMLTEAALEFQKERNIKMGKSRGKYNIECPPSNKFLK